MRFNLDDYPVGSNVVMHCSTEEEAVFFLKLLEEEGVCLKSINPSCTMFMVYKENTCYNFTRDVMGQRRVSYSNVDFYEINNYLILEAEDFCFKSDTRHNEVPKELTDFLIGIMPI